MKTEKSKFLLPKEIYYQTLYYVKRYPELKKQYAECIRLKSMQFDRPSCRSNTISDPTEALAEKCISYSRQLEPIEKGLKRIPEEYQEAIFQNVVYKRPFPDYADLNTWKRWKRRFLYYVYQYRIMMFN